MANKKVVFIHGEDDKQSKTPFMFYHFDSSEYSGTPVKGEDKTVDLVLFDFQFGTRQTWKNWKPLRSDSPPGPPDENVPLLPRKPIKDRNGNEIADTNLPSVTAFYRWVKIQPANSIISLQIFSHAVIHQPILYSEAYEWGDQPGKKTDELADRDPNDTEFRPRDFKGNNPLSGGDPWGDGKGSELAKFRAALDPKVFIKVWGCGEQTHSHNDGAPIRKLVTDYVKAKTGKVGDARRAQLVLNYLDHVEQFFPYRLAERLDLPVWAGPVGWGSDPNDVDGDYNPKTYAKVKYHYVGTFPPDLDKKELWWRVSLEFRKHKLKIAEKFFKGVLKVTMDNMGYVEYKKSWVWAAADAANAVLDAGAQGDPMQAPKELMKKLLDQMDLLNSGRSEP